MIEYTTKSEILKGIIEITRLLKEIKEQNREVIRILEQRKG